MTSGDSTCLIHYSEIRRPGGWELQRQCTLRIRRIIFLFKIIQWIVNERALFVAQPGQWGRKVIWSINYATQQPNSDTPPLPKNPIPWTWKVKCVCQVKDLKKERDCWYWRCKVNSSHSNSVLEESFEALVFECWLFCASLYTTKFKTETFHTLQNICGLISMYCYRFINITAYKNR